MRPAHRRANLALAASSVVLLVLPGCAGPGSAGGENGEAGGRAPRDRREEVALSPSARIRFGDVVPGDRRPAGQDTFGPSVLEPAGPADDSVVVRVGELEIRKSQVFDRLAQADPLRAREQVQLLVMDAYVADKARAFGIRVRPEEVETFLATEEDALRRELAGGQDEDPVPEEEYGAFIQRRFRVPLDRYREVARMEVTRLLYRGYVMRYLPMLEEQAVVRALWNSDRELVVDLERRVRQGADFATLARRHSEHASAADGGLLPQLGRGFPSPIAEAAFALEPGELSDVLEVGTDGATRFVLVYCLERRPARDVPFEEVRQELRADLERRPIGLAEQNAFVRRWLAGGADGDEGPGLDTNGAETGR